MMGQNEVKPPAGGSGVSRPSKSDMPDPVDAVVERMGQLSSLAIRRIIDAGEAIITERANDGVMG